MPISAADVEHFAMLSRLDISEKDLEAYTRRLGQVFDAVEKLKELDTEDVEPTAHVLPVVNVFREDEVQESIAREEAMKGAPEIDTGHFRVPKIV